MTAIQGTCASCKEVVQVYFGESIDGSRLVWHSAYTCDHCGAAVVMDDDGFPPVEIRDQLAVANGYWETVVDEVEEPLKTVSVLVELLGLNRIDALRLAKSLPGRVAIGTRTECEWLRQQLSQRSLRVTSREVVVAPT